MDGGDRVVAECGGEGVRVGDVGADAFDERMVRSTAGAGEDADAPAAVGELLGDSSADGSGTAHDLEVRHGVLLFIEM